MGKKMNNRYILPNLVDENKKRELLYDDWILIRDDK